MVWCGVMGCDLMGSISEAAGWMGRGCWTEDKSGKTTGLERMGGWEDGEGGSEWLRGWCDWVGGRLDGEVEVEGKGIEVLQVS